MTCKAAYTYMRAGASASAAAMRCMLMYSGAAASHKRHYARILRRATRDAPTLIILACHGRRRLLLPRVRHPQCLLYYYTP